MLHRKRGFNTKDVAQKERLRLSVLLRSFSFCASLSVREAASFCAIEASPLSIIEKLRHSLEISNEKHSLSLTHTYTHVHAHTRTRTHTHMEKAGRDFPQKKSSPRGFDTSLRKCATSGTPVSNARTLGVLRVLQCVAVCGGGCVVVCCSVCCSVLRCTPGVLQGVAVCYSVRRWVCCGVLQVCCGCVPGCCGVSRYFRNAAFSCSHSRCVVVCCRCVAVCCSVSQQFRNAPFECLHTGTNACTHCVALCHKVLQSVAVCCSVWGWVCCCVQLCFAGVLQCVWVVHERLFQILTLHKLCCRMLLCVAMCYCVLQCVAAVPKQRFQILTLWKHSRVC